jgi:hypothetical protein
MQTTKTLLLTCLLFLGMVLSKTTLGQSVANLPTTFTTVPNGNQNYSSISFSDSSSWFKWQTDSTVISINLKMLTANGRYGIKKARLFVEKNGHLENLSHQDLNLTDSTIFYFIQHLNINDNLYLNVQTEIKCSGCGSTPPTASLSFALLPQGCQLYNQPSCELVKDGGFEFFNMNCNQIRTIGPGQNWASCFWYFPNSSIFPGTSDYFNSCAPITIPNVLGYGNTANTTVNATSQGLPGLTAHNNTSGYAGIYTYISGVSSSITAPNDLRTYREYIVNKLNAPMVTGKTYIVSMYVRLSNASRYAIDNLGMLFTNNIPVQPMNASVPTVISSSVGQFIPTFNGYTAVTNKTGWTLLTTTISATSNYDHITIGNFRANAQTGVTDLNQAGWTTTTPGNAGQFPNANTVGDMAYYYIDDVSIRPIDLKVSPDVSICTPSVTPLTSTLSCAPSGATVTYTWAPTNGLSSVNTASTQASPTVTTTYTLSATVTFTNSDGTVSIIKLSDDVKVTVTNSGSFSLTATANPSIICLYAGSSTTLSTNAGANLSYTWTNGATTYTVPNPVVSPTVTTTYTVSTINCGVTYTAVTTVIVDTPPIISVNSNTVCNETAVSVTTTTNTSITYIDFGDPTSTSNVINPHIYSATGNYSITINTSTSGSCNTQSIIPISVVTATSSSIAYTVIPCSYNYTIAQVFNCSNITDGTFFEIYSSSNPTLNIAPTSSVVGGSFPFTFPGAGTYTITAFSYPTELYTQTTITVLAVSPPTVSIVAAPSKTICAGNSATLTASGVSTYTWMPGAVNGSTIAVTPTVTTNYTVTGTNAQGCIDSETITITVVPNVTLTATASPTAICSGQSSTLSASGAPSYTWMPGGMTSSVTVVSPTVTTTYTVTGANGICVDTKTVQVTVNPTPTINIITTNYSVCPGGIVIFNGTSAGVSTYTWAPCSSLCNTPGKNFYPTVTTTYTLSGTSAQGCVGTKTITIVVVPIPTITVNSATICAGNSATLTASGSNTYTWSPIASNASSIIVTPSVTTTYTVSGKNTGCATSSTKISTVTVSNGTIPSFSIVAPNSGNICASGTGTNVTTFSTSLSNTGLYGFTWTPGNSTSATPNFSITQPISVGVTVRDLACGTSSVQDVCINYVASSCCNNTLTTLTNTTITNVSQIPNSTYKVVGTLTFNIPNPANAVVLNKEFLMSTGSKIIVTPTTSLTLHVCKLYSCGGMWEGIELQNTSSTAAAIDINDGTTIEDAYVAVSANSYTTNLGNRIVLNIANFNKNYIDVQMKDWVSAGNTYNFTSLSSNFTSTSTATSPGGNLKCSQYYSPTIKARSAVGIYALNTTSVAVGAINTNTFYINTFNNKDYGIVYEKTSGNVTNARFSNMSGLNGTCQTIGCTPPLPTGIGVYATTNNATQTYINISSTPAPVTFSNVECAVYAKKITDLSVLSTSITNTSQGAWNNFNITSGIGYNGIYTEDIKRELHVNYNLIKNAYYGVQSNYTSAANLGILSISNNTIQTTATTFTTMLGINVSSAISFGGASGNKPIAANKLYLVRNGVQLTGLNTGVRVSNNNIDMVSGNGSNTTGSAIFLNGGNSACIIDNNTIRGNSTGSETTYNYNKLGINVKTSTNCLVKCNTINAVGTGVRYEGVCNTSNDGFFNNTLNGPIRRGVELKTSASIGTQGAYTGTLVTAVSKNQWAGTWTAANSDQTWVYDAGSSALNSRLCTGTSSSELPSDNQWNTGFPFTAISSDAYNLINNTLLSSSTAPAVSTCPIVLTQGLRVAGVNDSLETIERDKEFKLIITQNLTDPMLDTETKWQLKNYMYNAIEEGTAPNDATVKNFYNQEKTGSIDDYTNVDSLIKAGDYAQAMAVNSSANANVVTEQTTKDYNTLWLSKFSNPDYVATSSDIVTITDIANQCIHKGGNTVAYARALLNAIYNHPFDYDDDCSEYKPNLRIAQNTKNFESNGNEVHLYPNPNNGIFTLNYQIKDVADAEVIVEDVTGKLIYQKKLNMEITDAILKLTDAKNGIYFVKVVNGKEILSVNKVIINN